jgi:xanthine dehydrogenase accessory factor
MIGSRNKVLVTYRRLEEKTGVPKEEFIKRVRAPVGLEIGSDTPGEIAVAIVAELIQVRRQGLIRDQKLAGSPKSEALLKLAGT